MVFKLVPRCQPALSLAFIIFSRIISNVKNTLWGVTQKNKVFSTRVSVKFIIDIGISSVLHHLASLMVLYFDQDIHQVFGVLSIFQKDIWQDLGPACLLPENLKDLFETTGEQYQPQIYESITGVCRFLTRALSLKISQVLKNPEKCLTAISYHAVSGLSIGRIFKMWAYYVYLKSRERVDLRQVCSDLPIDTLANIHLPSKESIDTLENTIRNHKDPEYREFCWRKYPLHLVKNAPESMLGLYSSNVRQRIKKNVVGLRSLKTYTFLYTGLGQLIELPMVTEDVVKLPNHFIDDQISSPSRTFSEHSYHLVHNLSSAYLKILQLILTFKIPIDQGNISLADGEGSIAKLLFLLSGNPTYFNTLVNREQLIPQRGVNAMPAEFISHPEGVLLYNLCVLYGGNLLDDEYLEALLSHLPMTCGLITFDAEVSGEFSPQTQVDLCKSVMRIANQTKAEWMIYKFYINSVFCASYILSLINTSYNQIFLSVPIFSSHESYEIYAVCTKYNHNRVPLRDSSYCTPIGSASRDILQHLQDTRIKLAPFQEVSPVWVDLLHIARQLGFNNSLLHHFLKLTDFNVNPSDSDSNVPTMTAEALSIVDHLIKNEWNGLHGITMGHNITSTQKILVASTKGIHVIFDKFLSWKSHLLILQKMTMKPRYQDVEQDWTTLVDFDCSLYNNGALLYSYHFSANKLRRDIIRSLWVCWGHEHNIR